MKTHILRFMGLSALIGASWLIVGALIPYQLTLTQHAKPIGGTASWVVGAESDEVWYRTYRNDRVFYFDKQDDGSIALMQKLLSDSDSEYSNKVGAKILEGNYSDLSDICISPDGSHILYKRCQKESHYNMERWEPKAMDVLSTTGSLLQSYDPDVTSYAWIDATRWVGIYARDQELYISIYGIRTTKPLVDCLLTTERDFRSRNTQIIGVTPRHTVLIATNPDDAQKIRFIEADTSASPHILSAFCINTPAQTRIKSCVLSPDGNRIAMELICYRGVGPLSAEYTGLWTCNVGGSMMREVGHDESMPIRDIGNEVKASISPQWCADSKGLLFVYNNKLWKVPVP